MTRIRAIWVARLGLATELVAAYESAHHPRSGIATSLFAGFSILGAAVTAKWLARHRRALLARWSAQLRVDGLCGISILTWMLALTVFALPASLGLLDVGKGAAIAAFALSSVWVIRHRLRWIIAGLVVVALTNWLSSRPGSPRSSATS